MQIHLIVFGKTVIEAYLNKDTAYGRYHELKTENKDYNYYGIISYEIKDAPQPSNPADDEEQAAYDADCDHYNKYGWSPSH